MHSGFPSSILSQGILLVEESCMSMVDTFEHLEETDVKQLMKRLSNAYCAAVLLPTLLVKECLDILISQITKIVIIINRYFLKNHENFPCKTINKNQFGL